MLCERGLLRAEGLFDREVMEGIASIEALSALIRNRLVDVRFVIGIDGLTGVGKTSLAKSLGGRFGAPIVSLDDFVEQKRGAYVRHLRTSEIRAAVNAGTGPIIVDGVCLRAAAEHCGIAIDFHVYVRRLGKNGLWYEEQICLTEEPVEILKEEDRNLRRLADQMSAQSSSEPPTSGDEPMLSEELIDYHANYTPVQRADIIFDVVQA